MGDGASVGTKWVYSFGGGSSDGSAAMKNLLGGKGANLAELASLGLPVSPIRTASKPKSMRPSKRLSTRPAKCLAMRSIHCSSLSAPARAPRCRA